ncbi:TOBE domain-containing protein [Nitratireductor sp.]|uniref:TOBE domain-containing protein n=1 Tax=Nitratireductor sp. TaxID=1872084 RepID=UPI0025F743BA|nr:TOBE domain-containing protein [Nitratireductor sp.]
MSTGNNTIVSLGGRDTMVPIPPPKKSLSGTQCHFGERPEDMRIAHSEDFLFEGDVHFVERFGEVTNLYLHVKDVDDAVVVKVGGVQNYAKGDRVSITAPPEKMRLFTEKGRSFLHI